MLYQELVWSKHSEIIGTEEQKLIPKWEMSLYIA